MMQQGHGGGDRIVAMRTIDGAGMAILADAAGVAKSLASSDTGHHCSGQLLGHQSRTLFDVEFQVRADPRRIEERPGPPDRVRIEAAVDERGFETASVVRSRDGEAGRIEQSERATAPEIGDIEPGRLFSANAHDGDIARDWDSGPLERRQGAEARDYAGG